MLHNFTVVFRTRTFHEGTSGPRGCSNQGKTFKIAGSHPGPSKLETNSLAMKIEEWENRDNQELEFINQE